MENLNHEKINEKNYYLTKIQNSVNKLQDIKSESVILKTHTGLGDQIILNGLVNKISSEFKKIYLPVDSKIYDVIKFLYSNSVNVKVIMFENDKIEFLENFASKLEIDILNIGFENVKKTPFNLAFYKQLKIPYSKSFRNFYFPRNLDMEKKLEAHLLNFYKIQDSNRLSLIHNESSKGRFDLKGINGSAIYVTKESDIFNNLFFYTRLIEKAREIHCVDSSFLNLVERSKTKAKLYFHDLFGASIELRKDWYHIKYEY